MEKYKQRFFGTVTKRKASYFSRVGFYELKIPYDTAAIEDFADSECEALENFVTQYMLW